MLSFTNAVTEFLHLTQGLQKKKQYQIRGLMIKMVRPLFFILLNHTKDTVAVPFSSLATYLCI